MNKICLKLNKSQVRTFYYFQQGGNLGSTQNVMQILTYARHTKRVGQVGIINKVKLLLKIILIYI